MKSKNSIYYDRFGWFCLFVFAVFVPFENFVFWFAHKELSQMEVFIANYKHNLAMSPVFFLGLWSVWWADKCK